MTITLDIPEQLASQLGGGSPEELSRYVLESLVLEAYREERLGAPQAAHLLGLSRLQWNQLLKARQVTEHAYSVEDLERDVATLEKLRAEGVLPPA